MDVCAKLKNEFKLLPQKYSLVKEIDEGEINFEQFEIIENIKNKQSIEDPLAIPAVEEIAKMESYSADELADMMKEFNGLNFKVTKSFQKELDSVHHPNEEYSSQGAHHQPHFTQASDLEHSIREMFKEYKKSYYRPEKHEYDPFDKNTSIYGMMTSEDFDGCITYDIFTFKLLTYYSMLYKIFKLEYFTAKASSK